MLYYVYETTTKFYKKKVTLYEINMINLYYTLKCVNRKYNTYKLHTNGFFIL